MGEKYDQLTIKERETIAVLKAQGKSIRYIARTLERNHSTVLRELKRNINPYNTTGYWGYQAQLYAMKRKRLSAKRQRLKNEAIRKYVHKKLKKGWSPEQIAGRIKKDVGSIFNVIN